MKAKLQSKLYLDKRSRLEEVIPLETPYLLYLDPASTCNFQCSFCPTHLQARSAKKVMDYELFTKVMDDLNEFDEPLKVLRMNKIGEPLINKRMVDMVKYARQSGRVLHIDTTTNASLLNPEMITGLIDAGLDRMNISIEGVNEAQYLEIAKARINFENLVNTIKWLYQHKKQCEITIKVPGEYLSDQDKQTFFDVFGDHCDRIFIEELSPIWPEFDEMNGLGQSDAEAERQGQYKQTNTEKEICTYIFYAMVINADGTVSACCPDWDQKLIIGNSRTQSLKEIWNSKAMNDLRRLHLQMRRRENPVCGACGHIKTSQVDNIDDYHDVLSKKFEAYEQNLPS